MIQSLLNEKVSVMRRVSTGVDSLNNPVYGTPTGGAGWNKVYDSMPCRLGFSDRKIEFNRVGERVKPIGTLYYLPTFTLQHEDRILTTAGIEYIVTSIRTAYKTGSVIDHMEGIVELP